MSHRVSILRSYPSCWSTIMDAEESCCCSSAFLTISDHRPHLQYVAVLAAEVPLSLLPLAVYRATVGSVSQDVAFWVFISSGCDGHITSWTFKQLISTYFIRSLLLIVRTSFAGPEELLAAYEDVDSRTSSFQDIAVAIQGFSLFSAFSLHRPLFYGDLVYHEAEFPDW